MVIKFVKNILFHNQCYEWVREYCKNNNIKSILDIGSGKLGLYEIHIPNGISYYGYDPYEYNPVWKTYKYLPDNKEFDCCLMMQVIEHLTNKQLKEYKRIIETVYNIKHLIISTENPSCPFLNTYFWDNDEHIRPHNESSILRVFKNWKIVNKKYFGYGTIKNWITTILSHITGFHWIKEYHYMELIRK